MRNAPRTSDDSDLLEFPFGPFASEPESRGGRTGEELAAFLDAEASELAREDFRL